MKTEMDPARGKKRKTLSIWYQDWIGPCAQHGAFPFLSGMEKRKKHTHTSNSIQMLPKTAGGNPSSIIINCNRSWNPQPRLIWYITHTRERDRGWLLSETETWNIALQWTSPTLPGFSYAETARERWFRTSSKSAGNSSRMEAAKRLWEFPAPEVES